MKKLIVGNWKMNPQSLKEADILFSSVTKATRTLEGVNIIICPPFPFLSVARKSNSKKIALGAQDVSVQRGGAYTGEVSASMLRDMGVRYVIVGHSERRSFGETDEIINKKLISIFKTKLTPILCVGETVRHSDGSYLAVVKKQLTACLARIPKNQIKRMVIAYEPVWALSSTENRHDATPHDFEEMKIYIRKTLTDMFGVAIARAVSIIYGGSANKDNALSFLEAGADGLLPGKASLDPANFSAIVKIAGKIKNR